MATVPAGFQLDEEKPVSAPPGFQLDESKPAPTPPQGFQLDSKDAANKELAKSGLSVSSAGSPMPAAKMHETSLPQQIFAEQAPEERDPAAEARQAKQLSDQIYATRVQPAIDVSGVEGYPQIGGAVKKYVGTFTHPDQYGTEGEASKARTESGTQLLSGAATAARPLMIAGGAIAPIVTGGALALGYGGGKAAKFVAKEAGASPETQEFADTVGQTAIPILGAVGGIRGAMGDVGEGKGGFVSAAGDRVAAGVAKTPEGVTVAGKMGDRTFSKTFGGKAPQAPQIEPPTIEGETPQPVSPQPPPQPPNPAATAANDRLAEHAQTMARATAAENPPPPAPVPPPVTDQTAKAAVEQIQSLPPEQQPQAILEATKAAEASILHHGGAVVDGEVHRADTPQEAKKIATKLVNQQIAKSDEGTPEQRLAKQSADAVEKLKAKRDEFAKNAPQAPVGVETSSPLESRVPDQQSSGSLPQGSEAAGKPSPKYTQTAEELAAQGYTPSQVDYLLRKQIDRQNGFSDTGSWTPEELARDAGKYPRVSETHGDGTTVVYRAVPKGKAINAGDYVFLNEQDANAFRDEYGRKRGQPEIAKQTISNRDLIVPNTDSPTEAIYAPTSPNPQGVGTRSSLPTEKQSPIAQNRPVSLPENQAVKGSDLAAQPQGEAVAPQGKPYLDANGEVVWPGGKNYTNTNPSEIESFKAKHGIGPFSEDDIQRTIQLFSKDQIVKGFNDLSPAAQRERAIQDLQRQHANIASNLSYLQNLGDPVVTEKLRKADPEVQSLTAETVQLLGNNTASKGEADGRETQGTAGEVPKPVIPTAEAVSRLDSNLGEKGAHPEGLAPVPAKISESSGKITVYRGGKVGDPNARFFTDNADYAKSYTRGDRVFQQHVIKPKQLLDLAKPEDRSVMLEALHTETPRGMTVPKAAEELAGGAGAMHLWPAAEKFLSERGYDWIRGAESELEYGQETGRFYVKIPTQPEPNGVGTRSDATTEKPSLTESRLIGKGDRVTHQGKSGTVVGGAPRNFIGPVKVKLDSGETVEVSKRELSRESSATPEAQAAKAAPTAVSPVQSTPKSGSVARVPVKDLTLAPKRFQYKLNTDESGTTNLLKGQKWNPDLSEVISAWKDPQDGKTYVVNGHHRIQLARDNGVREIDVKYIDAKTAEAARATGALQNIASGRGTVLDAAKFFKDSGYTAERLKDLGVSMGEATAAKGVALAKLAPHIFEQVVAGKLRVNRGVAIGNATDNPEQQEAILKLVEKRERGGKTVTDETLNELARMVKGAGEHTETQDSLFGPVEMKKNLALEKAEVSSYIRNEIGQEKRVFGSVSDEAKASKLGKAGNVIETEKNAEIAQKAAQAQELYDKLSTRTGPLDDILNRAASELANGGDTHAIKARAYDAARQTLAETLGGATEGKHSGVQETPALPGLEKEVEAQKRSAAETQAEKLSNEIAQPKSDVSKAAGEMERESPLFHDSNASGQGGLFGSDGDPVVRASLFGLDIAAEKLIDAAKPIAETIGASLKEEASLVKQSRNLQSDIYDLEKMQEADQLRVKHLIEQTPLKPKDDEAIYHHLENPSGEPLTPAQQTEYQKNIKPFMDEAERIITKLRGAGALVPNYIHREVKDSGSWLDRALSGANKSKAAGKGNILSKSAPATKGRTMMALQDADGQRLVVSVKGGKVTAWDGGSPFDLGGLRSGLTTKEGMLHEQIAPINREIKKLREEKRILLETPSRIKVTFERRKNITLRIDKLERERDALINSVSITELKDQHFVDKNGREWRFDQATTKEIEANTKLQYHHSALGSASTNFLGLRKAERAYDFIEGVKASPGFSSIARKVSEGALPDGWKQSALPQLMGYAFEPHAREVLDWYSQKLNKEGATALEKVGQFLRTAVFMNPLLHCPNLIIHWTVEKGRLGAGVPFSMASSAGRGAALKAINAVFHQNDDYLAALDAGAPLQSHRDDLRNLNKEIFEKLGKEMEADPSATEKIAKALGYANPVKFVKAWYKLSGMVTWTANDIAFLQSAYEKTAHGMSLPDALKETARHIPDYRLPTRVLGSRGLAKFMDNPLIQQFSGYHYSALKSYGEAVKDALGMSARPPDDIDEPPNGPPTDGGEGGAGNDEPGGKDWRGIAHGWDILATIGLVTFVLYPLLDKAVRKASGNSDATVRRAGAATFPYNIFQLFKGERRPEQVLESVFTPSVLFKRGAELAFNRDLRTGRELYDPHAPAGTIAKQIGHEVGASISPIDQGSRAVGQEGGYAKLAWSTVGVSFPKHGAEKVAQEIAYRKMGTEAVDPVDRERAKAHHAIVDGLRKGDVGPLREARAKGLISIEEARTLIRVAHKSPLAAEVWNFNYPELMRVYNASTPEQRAQLERLKIQKARDYIKKNRLARPSAPPASNDRVGTSE